MDAKCRLIKTNTLIVASYTLKLRSAQESTANLFRDQLLPAKCVSAVDIVLGGVNACLEFRLARHHIDVMNLEAPHGDHLLSPEWRVLRQRVHFR